MIDPCNMDQTRIEMVSCHPVEVNCMAHSLIRSINEKLYSCPLSFISQRSRLSTATFCAFSPPIKWSWSCPDRERSIWRTGGRIRSTGWEFCFIFLLFVTFCYYTCLLFFYLNLPIIFNRILKMQGGYFDEHVVIEWFWDRVSQMTNADRLKLLQVSEFTI